MIRRENRAEVEFGTVGVFTKTPVVWVRLPTSGLAWKARLDGDVARSQSTTPAASARPSLAAGVRAARHLPTP
jgi:hypothetical protein